MRYDRKLAGAAALCFAALLGTAPASAQVTIFPNSSDFPIANAVEVGAGSKIIFHSGTTPAAANPDAERGTREYYGDTRTQTISVLERIEADLEAKGLTMGDVVKMTAFLVGDPEMDDQMDFSGFMEGYTQFFGTEEQPNVPARSTVQVAGLVAPLMFVEIEVITAR